MIDIFQTLLGIVLVLASVYIYNYYNEVTNYWKKYKIPGPKPYLLFGNIIQFIALKKSISECVKQLYDEYKEEPVFGIFDRTTPMLVVNDLDLIKDVLIKDFSLFSDRGLSFYPKVEPLTEHLFVLEPERWRPLRTNLSPVFTSGKLKEMFLLMLDCSMYLEKHLAKIADKEEPVDCRELSAKFTTDVIGNCVFGIDTSALSNEDSEFRRIGRSVLAPSTRATIRNFVREILPFLYKTIGHLLQPPGADKFFTKMVVDTINYRKQNNIYRPDFINILMELKNHPEKLQNVELTDTLLTAQAFVFFVAGFETSSTTIANTFYELAQNHDIQDKLREEIRQSDTKYGKILTYDRVKEMKYLNKVFKETLRKYPIFPVLMRQALENYTFRETKITIPKGTKMWIPVYGIQRNPNVFSDPEKFDPERFSEKAVAARHSMSYLPFGDGPRNCIGARFAYFQSKVGIITVLRNYKVDVCEKTIIPYKPDPRSFLLSLKGGVYLKITRA
ncbi:cytochrome P450 6A1-like isoform X1 [Osmia lignaria lignaria]|uniref:cytochrome P450 6A1-like isoform X1 n=1 Tax=Osmia lignaria lignaria TaxID=1437193 RepID=UPI00402BEEBC